MIKSRVFLVCDNCGLPTTEYDTAAEARLEAQKNGWHFETQPDGAYCVACVEKLKKERPWLFR